MQAPEDAEMQRVMNDYLLTNMFKTYNGIAEKCFNACVFNFRSPKLVDKEELCVNRCIEKYSKYTVRVQRVYAEQNLLQQQQQQSEEGQKPGSSS